MRLFIALFISAAVLGCTTIERRAVPEHLVDNVAIDGFVDVRFWGDAEPPRMQARAQRLLDMLEEQQSSAIRSGAIVQVSFLAISGGGSNGGFGAGLLNGWTRTGGRPLFRIVSGVSTGAIIAPFAFLGGEYDDELRSAYTQTGPSDIYRASILPNLFGGPALASSEPLENLIASFADETMLRAIAREHAKGRRLYVTTTNIDAGRPVIWDMGAIASSGQLNALELFRKVILASASLPGLFPPVQIDVVEDGQHFSELHMDGGITSQVFAYHPQVELGRLLEGAGFEVHVNVYVIWNGRRVPTYDPPEPRWYRLVERSADVQFNNQGLGDVRRIYALTQRDGAAFYLALIPDEFTTALEEPFAQNYMRELFAVGERAARDNQLWLREPP